MSFGTFAMAAIEFLSITSSPPRQFSNPDMSSSPPLPSLAELVQKKPGTTKSGSRPTPIPVTANLSFTSPASILKSITNVSQDIDTIPSFMLATDKLSKIEVEQVTSAKAKPRKAVTKTKLKEQNDTVILRKTVVKPKKIKDNATTIEPEQEQKPKKPRKSRAKKTMEGGAIDGQEKVAVPRKPQDKRAEKNTMLEDVPKEKPARKPRAKKTDSNNTQQKLAKGKVTKLTAKSKSTEAPLPKIDPFVDAAGFGLVDAVIRRANWTPPPPDAGSLVGTALDDEILGAVLPPGSSITTANGKASFTNLIGNFGFALPDGPISKKSPIRSAIRKRKLIELVKTSIATPGNTSPTKEKVPRKKARTITEQATSAYLDVEDQELSSNPAPLLQYFSKDELDQSIIDGLKVPPKPRSKSSVKGQPKAKKGSAQAPILLSPASALKQARNQDYVFGTSSQLAREDSPTLLRDLHEAMQASNEVDEIDDFLEEMDQLDFPVPTSKLAMAPKRNLWSAAARDSSGELMEVEMLDLANSSPVAARTSRSKVTTAVPLLEVINDNWHDVDAGHPQSPRCVISANGVVETGLVGKNVHELSSPPQNKQVSKKLPSKIHVARDSEPAKNHQISGKSVPTGRLKMPDFSEYPTAKLEKEIKSYGFKPVKGRNQMIALMQKCWEGKHGGVLEDLDSNTALITPASSRPPPSSQAPAASPKRTRGRPKKDVALASPPKAKKVLSKASNTVAVLEVDSDMPLSHIKTPKNLTRKRKGPLEEIEDSDCPSTSSPPRRQASHAGTLQLSGDNGMNLSPNSLQNLLFKHISRAVTNAPAGTDSKMPSWHEKILLYDPIVLEDLTVWLNTGALGTVGWDGEVEPKEVKKWCESKSICCLWRENLRGGARSRY